MFGLQSILIFLDFSLYSRISFMVLKSKKALLNGKNIVKIFL